MFLGGREMERWSLMDYDVTITRIWIEHIFFNDIFIMF